MALSIKRLFLVIVIALALLAGLIGGTAKMMAAPLLQQHHGASVQTHMLADGSNPNRLGCPPPPFFCE